MAFNILVHVFANLKWPNCSGNMYIGLFSLTGCSEHVGSDSISAFLFALMEGLFPTRAWPCLEPPHYIKCRCPQPQNQDSSNVLQLQLTLYRHPYLKEMNKNNLDGQFSGFVEVQSCFVTHLR
jgi:hypothetical protein